MDKVLLAYLAGAIDSDGSIGIKKSTYHMRVRKDATNAVYSERVLLKQTTPDIPFLLKENFGGGLAITKGGSKNSKPLYSYSATDKIASNICRCLLPYLRVKKRHAEIVLELRETKDNDDYKKYGYWYALNNPKWRESELITTAEAKRLLNYKTSEMVSQAVSNGTLLAIPPKGSLFFPRIPLGLVEEVVRMQSKSKDGRARIRPDELISWRESLWQEIGKCNTIGVNGTKVNHRIGVHKPL